MSRSPLETLTYGRGANSTKRKVLTLVSKLSVPSHADCENGTYTPLQEPRYSRFVLTLIDKDEYKTTALTANIPASVVDEIVRNYKEAASVRCQIKYLLPKTINMIEGKYGPVFTMLNSYLQNKVPNGMGTAPAPYTCKFAFSAWRGKTIPEVVGENPSAEDAKKLQAQRDFLMKNLSKYPANKAMVSEIDRALEEIENGTFQQGAANTVSAAPTVIEIYKAQNNFLKSRIDSENRVFCYDISMVCNTEKDQPWEIRITNGYSPLEKDKSGRELPRLSQMVNKTQTSFSMSDAEASYFFSWMEKNRAEFVNMHYPEQLKKALKMQADAITAATKE